MITKSFNCPPNVWSKIGELSKTFLFQTTEAETVRLHFGQTEPSADTNDYLLNVEYDPGIVPFTFPEHSYLWVMPHEAKAVRIVAVTRP